MLLNCFSASLTLGRLDLWDVDVLCVVEDLIKVLRVRTMTPSALLLLLLLLIRLLRLLMLLLLLLLLMLLLLLLVYGFSGEFLGTE